eukprot:9490472-Pyramimonas_sp.AAC.1
MSSLRPQEAPRRPQEAPKMPREAPRKPQEAPEKPQRALGLLLLAWPTGFLLGAVRGRIS